MPLSKSFTTVTSFSKILALALFVLLPLVTFFLGINYGKMVEREATQPSYIYVAPTISPAQNPAEETTMCTMDAKQCSDGSFVGRSGPKCEFAACPK